MARKPSKKMLVAVRKVRVGKGRRTVDRGTVLALAASMREHGLLQEIGVTPTLTLLWGAHRLAAARVLRWKEIPAAIHDVRPGSPEAELLEIDENLIRADLSVLQRAEQTARRKKVYERIHPETRRGVAGGKAGGRGRRRTATATVAFANDTARSTGRSRRAVELDAQIGAALTPAAITAIRGTPLEDHTRTLLALAMLPREQQTEAVRQGELAILRAAQEVRRRRADERRAARVESYRSQAASGTAGVLGRFAIIYADPPWSFDHPISISRQAEEHYPTMTMEAITRLQVASIATPDSVLLLWSPVTILAEALEVMAAWGWSYKTHIVWDKQRIGLGYYVRNQHELLLIGTRGDTLTPSEPDRPPSVTRARPGRHSEKPTIFYDLIEKMWPGLPKVELFARRARAGWTALGHETSGGDLAAPLKGRRRRVA